MIELDKIMELLGVTTDRELAEKLGHSAPSTVSSWRSRGKVPAKVLREWALRFGKPVEWFSESTIEKPQVPEHLKLLFEIVREAFPTPVSLIEKDGVLTKVLKELRDAKE